MNKFHVGNRVEITNILGDIRSIEVGVKGTVTELFGKLIRHRPDDEFQYLYYWTGHSLVFPSEIKLLNE